MPLYEYTCPKCGDFEQLQKISDPPLAKHTCGKPVKRKVSLSTFHLKGGGWYKDLYGSSKSPDAKKATGGSEKAA